MSLRKNPLEYRRSQTNNIALFSTIYTLLVSILALSVTLLFIYSTNDVRYLALILILPICILVIEKPVIGLDIFFFWLIVIGYIQPVGIVIFGANLLIIDLIALLALPAVINAAFVHRETEIQPDGKPFTFIYFFLFLSVGLGIIKANNFQWISPDIRLFIYMILLYFWTSILLQEKKHLKQITTVILIAVALAGAKSIIIEYSGFSSMFFNTSWQANSFEVGGLGITRVTTGGLIYMAMFLPVVAALFFANSRRYKYLAITVLPFVLVGLVLSFTRTAWLAACFGFLFIFFYSLRNVSAKKYFELFLLLFFIAVFISGLLTLSIGSHRFEEAAKNRLQSLFNNQLSNDPNVSARVEESKTLLSSLGLNIFFGKGIGATYQFYVSPTVPPETGWSHNGWAWLILKGGVVGLVLVIIALYLATKQIVKYGLSNEDNVIKLISAGYLGAMVAFVAMSFAINALASLEGAVFLGLYFGMARNMRRYSQKSEESSPDILDSL